MSAALPVIDASGTNREIGRAIGESTRDRVQRAVGFMIEHSKWWAGVPIERARERALSLLPHAEPRFGPQIYEIEGMAEGAGVAFADLLVLNCGEELTCSVAAPAGRCTSIALSAPGRTVVAHNEDWSESDVENVVVVRMTLPDGTRVVSVVAAGYLPVTGVNSHGIAVAADTVYGTDERAGIPNSFISRRLLESSSPEETVRRAALLGRGRGANRLCGQSGGRLWNIETSAERIAVDDGASWLAHTNHYLSKDLADVEGSTSAGSRHRLTRARAVIDEGRDRGDDPATIARTVLRDHDGVPRSVCSHPVPGDASHGPTTASMIWELEERRMQVCAGRPCEHPYTTVAVG
ncbi:MAG: isopenicillin-N N-acyltransferase like protein [Gaiellales bacterium]|jgi:isopenicillin-N N-acyltransferase-like protein|nr:isopenicillin-N N-acyltransferase like protein [Gaiellales bacterium]